MITGLIANWEKKNLYCKVILVCSDIHIEKIMQKDFLKFKWHLTIQMAFNALVIFVFTFIVKILSFFYEKIHHIIWNLVKNLPHNSCNLWQQGLIGRYCNVQQDYTLQYLSVWWTNYYSIDKSLEGFYTNWKLNHERRNSSLTLKTFTGTL